jgi:hypothetical protein
MATSQRRYAVGFGATVAVAVVHALVVAPRYHVGSFDDDSAYVMAGRAIASGHGITSRLAGGYPLVGVYPPGYPALLSPLAALWPSSVDPFRILSLVLVIAIFPLTWVYLRRRRVPETVCLLVLALLAMNPVLATYATMVMGEAPFIVAFLLLLLVAERWEQEPQTISWAGGGTVALAAALLWLKEAGLGLVIGLVAWLVLRRLWRKAMAAAVGPALLVAPLLILRVVAGASLIGSRYDKDLGPTHGSIPSRLIHLAPAATWSYISEAVPRSILPSGMGVFQEHGVFAVFSGVFLTVSWITAPLVIVGFVVWCRRHADAACLMVPVYLAETLVFPFTNERRVILVLPVIMAWFALGAAEAVAALRRRTRTMPKVGVGLPAFVALIALVSLVGQFPRDYLYDLWGNSSSPGGSGYMAILRQLGTPQSVVDTDYLWTTARYTGHRTLNGAYEALCTPDAMAAAIRADDAGFLLTSELNGGGRVDDDCILPVVAELPGAVRLYRSARDRASVFELVGPGTGNPDVADLTPSAVVDGGSQTVTAIPETKQTELDPAGHYLTLPTTNRAAVLTWSWAQPVAISQISLGAAGAGRAVTTSVTVSVRLADGTWRVVATAAGAVGSGNHTQFLLAHLPDGTVISALRVTVTVNGTATVAVHDVHALGPTAAPMPA